MGFAANTNGVYGEVFRMPRYGLECVVLTCVKMKVEIFTVRGEHLITRKPTQPICSFAGQIIRKLVEKA